MQFKTTMKYPFIPTRMPLIKKTVTGVGKDRVKLEPSYTADRNGNLYNLFGKQSGSSSKS